MGHYAVDMSLDDAETKKLRKKYWSTREKLESISASKFSVGQLQEIGVILSEGQTPGRGNHGSNVWVKDLIDKMEKLIPKVQLKKPNKK